MTEDRSPDAAVSLPPGFALVWRETVVSTNDEARRLAAEGAPAGTVVWAGRQESGRGRRGRVWDSPHGNLYGSVILRPGVAAKDAAQLSFVAALAIARTVEAFLPPACEVRCKWPNDVLVDGRKIAGILLETEAGPGEAVAWIVLGVGVNVLNHPAEAERPATSLLAEGGEEVLPDRVLEAFLHALAHWTGVWAGEGFPAVREAWLARAVGVGGPVVVRLADRTLTGTFADLDTDGILLLDPTDGGPRQRIAAGDVFFPTAQEG